jgi:hypothetical protein
MAPSRRKLAEILPLFFKLLHSNCKGRKCILEGASEDLINSLSKCAHIYLRGHLGGSKNQLSKLRTAKWALKILADEDITSRRKRDLLLQEGNGFLGPLISLAIPFLLKFISK